MIYTKIYDLNNKNYVRQVTNFKGKGPRLFCYIYDTFVECLNISRRLFKKADDVYHRETGTFSMTFYQGVSEKELDDSLITHQQ